MRYIIILIILILGYQGTCWSQGNDNGIEQVVFPGVKKWGHPTSIQFYDTISRKLINNFDFSEKSPYKLPYRLTSVSRDTTVWEFEIVKGTARAMAVPLRGQYPGLCPIRICIFSIHLLKNGL